MKKNKELVTIRSKKLKDGSESLYLDIYENGRRTYEFLKLYIHPGNDPLTRQTNKSTMQAAKVIQARRTIEVQNGMLGIKSVDKKLTFVEYYKQYLKEKTLSPSIIDTYDAALKWWLRYDDDKTPLQRIDRQLIIGFSNFLKTTVSPHSHRLLKGVTALMYVDCVIHVLEWAHDKGVIKANPVADLEKGAKPKALAAQRQYLTKEELERMIDTPCEREYVKEAFLFSCFTGLRKSDIHSLTWNMILDDKIEMRMQKTKEMIYIPLSDNAKRWLPKRGKPTERIFSSYSKQRWSAATAQWAKDAGVNKHITFHCARHTFATMLLTYGADITVVSKLLGHHNLATTMIYAKIIDKRKVDAVNMIPKI